MQERGERTGGNRLSGTMIRVRSLMCARHVDSTVTMFLSVSSRVAYLCAFVVVFIYTLQYSVYFV